MYDDERSLGIHDIVTLLDYTLDTARKRHIVGGILISVSLLFGGLALTTMTLGRKENSNDNVNSNQKHVSC